MKKTLTIILLLTSVISFGQIRKTVKLDVFTKDYNILQFIDQKILGDSTAISTLLIFENGLKRLVVVKTDINLQDNSYKNTRLNVSHREIYKNMNIPYLAKDGNIYRIRTEKNGASFEYFLDKFDFSQSNFTRSEKFFHSGLKTQGYTYLTQFYESNSHYFLVSSSGTGFGATISINTFNKDFTLLSKLELPSKKANKESFSRVHGSVLNDNLYLYYKTFDPIQKAWKVKICQTDGLQYDQFEYAAQKSQFLKNYIIYGQNGKVFLYTLISPLRKNEDWVSTITEINPQTHRLNESKSTNISINTIVKGNKNKYLSKNQYSADYNYFDCYFDIEQNSVYLFNYACDLLQTFTFDCLITKIENNGIVWNQYINTPLANTREYGYNYLPSLPFNIYSSITNNKIIMDFRRQEKIVLGVTTKGNYIVKKIEFDKGNGEFINDLIKK